MQASVGLWRGVEMLDYEWESTPTTMISGEELVSAMDSDLAARQIFNHYSSSQTSFVHQDNSLVSSQNALFHHHLSLQQADQPHIPSPYDHQSDLAASDFVNRPLPSHGGSDFLLIPKSEDVFRPLPADYAARIGKNLGGRTYFSSSDVDFVTGLHRRGWQSEPSLANSPKCQAVGCTADLSHSKHYHRRHKVCEFHSKASAVIAAGLTQRFCQQCSRFHLLAEFDNVKRSCRRRLADHNRRRRKVHQSDKRSPKSQPEIPSSSTSLTRSPADSGAHSSSSVTVAMSPPAMSIDRFRQRSCPAMTSSSSNFFPCG